MLVAKTLRADTSYVEVTNSSVVLFATRVIIVVLKKANIMVEHYKLSALEAGWDSQAHELIINSSSPCPFSNLFKSALLRHIATIL